MKKILTSLTTILFLLIPTQLDAGILTIHVGPVALGGGGPNPVSIPPTQPVEYEFIYLTKKNSEFRLSVSPGLFYGVRSPGNKYGVYVSAGGGLVINGNGAAPGIYSAFGYNGTCDFVCFNIEYLKAVGFKGTTTLNPYALRAGVSLYFK